MRTRYLAPTVEEILALVRKEDDDSITDEEGRRLGKLQVAREAELLDAVPKLTCCDAARGFDAVRFSVEGLDDQVPERGRWRVREHDGRDGLRRRRRSEEPPDVRFCPFCAAPVPRTRRMERPPLDLCVVTDGGYYCDTCFERLNGCLCLPPEAAFEVVATPDATPT